MSLTTQDETTFDVRRDFHMNQSVDTLQRRSNQDQETQQDRPLSEHESSHWFAKGRSGKAMSMSRSLMSPFERRVW